MRYAKEQKIYKVGFFMDDPSRADKKRVLVERLVVADSIEEAKDILRLAFGKIKERIFVENCDSSVLVARSDDFRGDAVPNANERFTKGAWEEGGDYIPAHQLEHRHDEYSEAVKRCREAQVKLEQEREAEKAARKAAREAGHNVHRGL